MKWVVETYGQTGLRYGPLSEMLQRNRTLLGLGQHTEWMEVDVRAEEQEAARIVLEIKRARRENLPLSFPTDTAHRTSGAENNQKGQTS